MAQVTITANGTSAPIDVGPGQQFITLIGTWGGATVKLEWDVGRGFVPYREVYDNGARANYGFTANDTIILVGPCQLRAVTTGATSPSILLANDPIPKIV